jgi:16S rRNA (guanine966-N2)-methyltransferase
MRVIAGSARGRRLAGPPAGAATRPTSDKVREALFSTVGARMEGAGVLDLFAGTGALGLEALSRGAAYVHFVEDSAEARGLIRGNADALGVIGVTKIYRRDATKLGDAGTLRPFDLLFADPPYGKGLAERALSAASAGGWLSTAATAVVEERADAEFTPPDGFTLLDRRVYGDTAIHFLRFAA